MSSPEHGTSSPAAPDGAADGATGERVITFSKAVNEALAEEMRRDPDVFIIGEDREPRTLLRSQRIRWPDALSFGPDGWLYVADSALQDGVLRPQEHIQANSPYGQ